MRWVLAVVVAVLVLAGVVMVVGLLLPVSHVAGVRARIPAPADSVHAVVRDVSTSAEWRSDVDEVRVLSGAGEPLRWEEEGAFGVIRFVREDESAPTRLVSRIDGMDQGFGGTWTWRIEPDGAGSVVTVTERGEVYHPVFRFLSRFVFGHYGTMESYVGDLGRRFGAEVEVERID